MNDLVERMILFYEVIFMQRNGERKPARAKTLQSVGFDSILITGKGKEPKND